MNTETDANGLAAAIFRACHLIGEFRLRSGATSTEYFDKYLFEANPALLGAVAAELATLLPERLDALAGLELGGVPIATAISLQTGIPVRFVRKVAKDYGTCRLAEGGEIDGLHVTIVEDVVTSGGQVIESARELRHRGALVQQVLCVIDRQAGGAEALAAEGLELRALFTGETLKAAAAREHRDASAGR